MASSHFTIQQVVNRIKLFTKQRTKECMRLCQMVRNFHAYNGVEFSCLFSVSGDGEVMRALRFWMQTRRIEKPAAAASASVFVRLYQQSK